MVRFSSPEGFPPHPRHNSNDIESLEINDLIGELALNNPELYSDAQKIAASASAILALESLIDLRKTSPPLDNANDEVMVDLSGGSDAIATLATEKQAGRVGGVLEGVGILRKSSLGILKNCEIEDA